MLVISAFSVLCCSLVLAIAASYFTPIVFSPESSQSGEIGLVKNAELIGALTKTAQYIHAARPWHLSSGYCMDIVNKVPLSYSGYAVSPVIYSSDTSQCGEDILEDAEFLGALDKAVQMLRVPRSCKDIFNASPSPSSGYYNITINNGSIVQVYCDMELTHCGGGWTRVAFVNMSEPGATCPQGLVERNFSSLTLCSSVRNIGGCSGPIFSTPIRYSKVCGRVLGYQYGPGGGFYNTYHSRPTSGQVDGLYVVGVSIITHGSASPRHIWSLASIYNQNKIGTESCPCQSQATYNVFTPSFVGNDYYCESGTAVYDGEQLYADDMLWDGQQCGGLEATCCSNPNMPWFSKTLDETTSDSIQLRLCSTAPSVREDTPLKLIELYVQ